MEEVKELIFDLLLFGHTVNEEELISMLGILNSKTFEDSSDVSNALFVEKCLPFFALAREEDRKGQSIESIDLFIDEYKRLLIKDEQYELINTLDL